MPIQQQDLSPKDLASIMDPQQTNWDRPHEFFTTILLYITQNHTLCQPHANTTSIQQ